MLLKNYSDKKYIKQYTPDTWGLTKEEKERNRTASILRGAIDLMLDIRNMGIHGVEDIRDEARIHEADYKMFMEVNKVLVKYMLEDEPLLTQNRPVGLFFSMYNIVFTWLRHIDI
mgnify:CR=1 FL=1